MPLASQKPYTQLYVGPAPPAATVSGPMATTRPATAGQRRAPTDRRRGHRTRSTPRPPPSSPLLLPVRRVPAVRRPARPRPRGRRALPPRPAPARAAPRPRLQGKASPGSPPSSTPFPCLTLCLSLPQRTQCGDAIAARGELAPSPPRAASSSSEVRPALASPSSTGPANPRPPPLPPTPPPRAAAARHRAPTRPAVGSPFRATPAPPLYHRRLPHLTAHLTRPSSPPLGARAAEAGSRRRLRARAAAAPVQVAAPPLLSATGDEAWGKRTPADRDTFPDPVGLKPGPLRVGAARGNASRRALSALGRRKKKTAHHGIKEPTQDLPLIEKPDDKWNPEHEDDVSLSWPSL
ncbi:hypothetical protein U9M48_031338 [Paspalum notatum var. saurae]|uniref:Uncharacterized protein n=1 Tax=Paspalum notatum var. saurae TaxID=547442 RepID=A0AAQ3U2V1_PASNO